MLQLVNERQRLEWQELAIRITGRCYAASECFVCSRRTDDKLFKVTKELLLKGNHAMGMMAASSVLNDL